MKPLPSPSKLPLLRRCAFPWSPHAPEWTDDEPGRPAVIGNAGHEGAACAVLFGDPTTSPLAWLDLVAKHGLTPAEARDVRDTVGNMAAFLEASPAHFRAAEVSCLYDVERDVARVLPAPLPREQVPAGHVHATLDLVEGYPGRFVVSDWKTGAASAVELVASDDPQLHTYALIASRAFGPRRDFVDARFLHASPEGVRVDEHHLGGFALAAARAELRRLLARAEVGGVPTPGRHCDGSYCPISARCPSTIHALAQIVEAVGADLPMRFPETAAEAARVLVGVQVVESALAWYRQAVRAYADRHGPFEVAPGVKWGPVESSGTERLSAEYPGATNVLREMLGVHADTAIEVSSSKAAIERAARELVKANAVEGRGALKNTVEPILDRLRSLGAIRQGAPVTSYKEIREKKAKATK